MMAASCEESAGSGLKTLSGGYSASKRRGSGKGMLERYGSRGVSSRCATTGDLRRSSVRSTKSFHIRYLANENTDSTTSSFTSQPRTFLMAVRTRVQMPVMSSPCSPGASSPAGTPSSS